MRVTGFPPGADECVNLCIGVRFKQSFSGLWRYDWAESRVWWAVACLSACACSHAVVTSSALHSPYLGRPEGISFHEGTSGCQRGRVSLRSRRRWLHSERFKGRTCGALLLTFITSIKCLQSKDMNLVYLLWSTFMTNNSSEDVPAVYQHFWLNIFTIYNNIFQYI